ncbi:MAG: hypothetical protein HYY13_08435 [Nitrospirae bacterium]|nr:hypothetical protein [Nitrospirota bacterium]
MTKRLRFSFIRAAMCGGVMFYAFACSSGDSQTSSCGTSPTPPAPSAVANTLGVRINDRTLNYAEYILQQFLNNADTKNAIRSLLSSSDALTDMCLSVPLIGNACVALFIEDNDGDFGTDRNANNGCTGNESFTDTNGDFLWGKGEGWVDANGTGYDHDSNPGTANKYFDPGETFIACDDNDGNGLPDAAWGGCTDTGADTDTCAFAHYVIDCGPDGTCGNGDDGNGQAGRGIPASYCTLAQLFFDRDAGVDLNSDQDPCNDAGDAGRLGINNAGDGVSIDFTPTVSIAPSLGADLDPDTLTDIQNGTVDDRLDITLTLANFGIDLVAKPNPLADGCGEDTLCGVPNEEDDEPDKFINYMGLAGNATIPSLSVTMGIGVIAGDFASGNAAVNPGTELGIELDPLDLDTNLTLVLKPETPDDSDLSHLLSTMLPYIEIATLRYFTEGYDSGLDFFLYEGLPLMDLNDTLGGSFEHPLVPGTNIAMGLGLNFGMTTADDNADDVGDAILLRGGMGLDLAWDGTNCVDANGTNALSWGTALATLGPNDPSANPYMIGAGMHENALSSIIYNMIKSGILCMTIDTATLEAMGLDSSTLPIDLFSTDTFGLLMPKLVDPSYGNLAGKAMRFVLRPSFKDPLDGQYTAAEDTPYILAGGPNIDLPAANPYGDVSPGISMEMVHLTLDFQVDTSAGQTGTWQRVFGLDLSTGLSMGVGIDRDTSCTGCFSTTMRPRITLEADPEVDSFLWYDEAVVLVGAGYDPGDPGQQYAEVEGVLSNLLPLVLSGVLQADILPRIEISEPFGIGDPRANPPRGITLTTGFVGGTGADSPGGGADPETTNTSGDTFGMFMSIVEDLDGDCTPPELANGTVDACESENYLNPNDVWNLVCGDMIYDSMASDPEQADTAELICQMCAGANHCPAIGNDPDNCTVSLPSTCGLQLAPARFQTAGTDFTHLAPQTVVDLGGDLRGADVDLLNGYQSADAYGLDPHGGSVISVGYEDRYSHPSEMVYSHRVDGGAWSHFRAESEITLPPLLEGLHSVEVMSRNRLGVVDSSPAVVRFWMDHVAPIIRVNGLQGDRTVLTHSPAFNVQVADFVAGPTDLYVSYRLDGADWQIIPAETTLQFEGLAEGEHLLEVRASDPAGNGRAEELRFEVATPEEKASEGGCETVVGHGSNGSAVYLAALGLALIALRRRSR